VKGGRILKNNWRWLGIILLVVLAISLGSCSGGTTASSTQTPETGTHIVKVYTAPG